ECGVAAEDTIAEDLLSVELTGIRRDRLVANESQSVCKLAVWICSPCSRMSRSPRHVGAAYRNTLWHRNAAETRLKDLSTRACVRIVGQPVDRSFSRVS